MDNNPLVNPANWNKPLTMVVPLEITIMVDDPSNPGYKSLMQEKVIKPMLNELRSICQNMDRGGKQLVFRFLDAMELSEFENLKKGKSSISANSPPVDFEAMMENFLKKKGLA